MKEYIMDVLSHMGVILSHDPIAFILFKLVVLVGAGAIMVQSIMMTNIFVIRRLVPKDVRFMYYIVLYILAPLLLINGTYWFAPLEIEISYLILYALFWMGMWLVFAHYLFVHDVYCYFFAKEKFTGFPIIGAALFFICLYGGAYFVKVVFYQ